MSSANYGLTTFSSKGSLESIENAIKATNISDTVLTIKGKNCVFLLSQKSSDKSIDFLSSKYSKICNLNSDILITYSGLSGDFIILKEKAISVVSEYFLKFQCNIPINLFLNEISLFLQKFSKLGGVRPLGLQLFILCREKNSNKECDFSCYQMNPAGIYDNINSGAIGKDNEKINEFINRNIDSAKDLTDIINVGLKAFKNFNNNEINSDEVEVFTGADDEFICMDENKINLFIDNLE